MSSENRTRRDFLRCSGAAALGAWMTRQGLSSDQGSTEPPHFNDVYLFLAPPGVFRPTASGAVLHWVSAVGLESRVLAGDHPDRLALVREMNTNGPTEVALTGFQPDSDVHYQWQFRTPGATEWTTEPVRKFHTARRPGSSFRVALIADSHFYSVQDKPVPMENLATTIAHVLEDRPDFVIFLGDEAGVHFLQDRPGFMNAERAVDRWIKWRQAVAALLAEVPSYMVLGNHEGEAGFDQANSDRGPVEYLQRWGTIARKRCYLNPLPDTYPEGGENEGWSGDPNSPSMGGASEGNLSPLQNYFAWSWGDALFVVLDVHRYTRIGQSTPNAVEQWTLGEAQMKWLDEVLTSSHARWKFVIAHHLVGGSHWDLIGKQKDTDYVYGRGGARYALVGEQKRITELMQRNGARFFLYGHDHVFCHQQAEGLNFVCCGRPTYLQPDWWVTPGWREAYGDTSARNPHDFHAALGYTRLDISAEAVTVSYIRTGTDRQRAENVDTTEGQTVYSFRQAP